MSDVARIEPKLSTRVRVYHREMVPEGGGFVTGGGYTDFDAQKIEVASDGSMILHRITPGGDRLNPKTGKFEQGFEVRILAVIGPDGAVRAETVEVEE